MFKMFKVPHLHIVYGYTDAQGRYWSLPIDWKDMQVSCTDCNETSYAMTANIFMAYI